MQACVQNSMNDTLIWLQSMLYIRPITLWGLYVKGVDALGSSQDEQVQIIALCYASQKRKARQVFQDVAALEESTNILSQWVRL